MAKNKRSEILAGIATQVMPNDPAVDEMTIGEAKKRMRPKITANGCRCKLCTRHLQVYPRVLNWAKAFAVTALYRQYLKDGKQARFYKIQDLNRALADEIDASRAKKGLEPMRGRTTLGGGEPAQAFIWGLIEKDPERRGYFRLTNNGILFAQGYVVLKEVAVMFCGEFHSFAGREINIGQAYKRKFDQFDLSMPEFLRAKEVEELAEKQAKSGSGVTSIPVDKL